MMELVTRVSNSKLKTWRRCPNKFRYKYVERLRPKKRAIQLERGSWIHDLLQHHYDGEDWKDRQNVLTKEFWALFEEEREDLGDLPSECKQIMRAYVRKYKNEDRQYRVVDSELDEIVTLPNGLQLNVIIDLIMEDSRGGLWAWDHKTRKNFDDDESMMRDPQLTLYFYALELMGYKPMRGVVYNEIRTKPPSIPKLIKTGGLSKARIDTTAEVYMAEIRKHDLDPSDYTDILQRLMRTKSDAFFRRTPLPKDPPVLKQMVKELSWSVNEMNRAIKKNQFPRTYDKNQCKWDCEFSDICLAELYGGDPEPLIKQGFERSRRGE